MKKLTRYRKLLLFVPFLLGAIGLIIVAQQNPVESLFNCVRMYVINYSELPPNLWVQLARWTAPLATASGILMMISSANQSAAAGIRYLLTDSVAVYGPPEERETLLSQLGRRGVNGTDRLLPAHRYILLDEQKKNLAFYEEHRHKLAHAQIYLRSEDFPSQAISSSHLHLFRPEENIARLFWKRGEALTLAEEKEYRLNIVLLGFGCLGEELLYWGLQYNVFAPGQKICYHVFGDSSDFLAAHPMLGEICDEILPYEDGWTRHLPVLVQADLILVLPPDQGEAQEANIYRLLSLLPGKELTVFSSDPLLLRMLDGQERLTIVDMAAEGLLVSHILEDELLKNARRINLRYAHLYKGVEETAENAAKEWEKLDAFTRYSNISSADYHEIRVRIMGRMGAGSDGTNLSPEQKELLSELEHMRWCRYHWLNNWCYGIPENGKAKDSEKRIHIDLVPYEELSEGEKAKDRDTINVMLGI